MIASLIRTQDGVLGEVLESLLGHLQGHSYARFRTLREPGPSRDAGQNRASLQARLRNPLETRAAVPRTIGSGSPAEVAELERDHRLLGLYVRYLGSQLRQPNGEREYGVARSFLTMQLDHLPRETEGVGRWAPALEASSARRLRALIERCGPPGEGEPWAGNRGE